MSYFVAKKVSSLYTDVELYDLLAHNKPGFYAYQSRTNHLPLQPLIQAFATEGKLFQVIEGGVTGILVPFGEGINIIQELTGGSALPDKLKLLRKAQRYTVNVYENSVRTLTRMGALVFLEDCGVFLLKDGFYSAQYGISLERNSDPDQYIL